MKSQSYMTRALKSRDPRFARILGKLGYSTTELVADDPSKKPKPKAKVPSQEDPRMMLRAEYERVIGKKPFGGWDVDELKKRINEAQNPAPQEGGSNDGDE